MTSTAKVPDHMDPAIQALRTFDAKTADELKWFLFNDKNEKFAKWEKVLSDPIFHRKFNLSLPE